MTARTERLIKMTLIDLVKDLKGQEGRNPHMLTKTSHMNGIITGMRFAKAISREESKKLHELVYLAEKKYYWNR